MLFLNPWDAWWFWFALFAPPPAPPCIERRGNVTYVSRSVWRANREPGRCRAEMRLTAHR